MKYTIQFIWFLLLGLPCLLSGQVYWVNNTADTKVMSSTDLVIDGHVINKSDGSISNEGTIYLTGNWTRLGTASDYDGAGWIWFEGSSNQTITSSTTINIGSLGLNNGNLLIQNADLTVASSVNLSNNGSILLGTNDLAINSGGSISNYDASNHVITDGTGVLQQEVGSSSVFFPVGNATYNPATLSNSGTTDNFLVRVTNEALDRGTTGNPITEHFVGRTWMVSEEVSGGSNATLTVQWAAAQELTSFDRDNCLITHWDGAQWDSPIPYTAATANGAGTVITQTRSGLTSFSPFSVGDNQSLVLPVELLDFTAERKDQETVRLDWSTASEQDNAGFYVERRLENETEFSQVAWVDGAGTSTEVNRYLLLDDNTFEGTSYYRLQQKDFGGGFSYSAIRAVEGIKDLSSNTVGIYPIPTDEGLHIKLTDWEHRGDRLDLSVMDLMGRVLLTKQISIGADELIYFGEIEYLPSGQYLLRGDSNQGGHFMKKFIIAREE